MKQQRATGEARYEGTEQGLDHGIRSCRRVLHRSVGRRRHDLRRSVYRALRRIIGRHHRALHCNVCVMSRDAYEPPPSPPRAASQHLLTKQQQATTDR
ncbi:hypothetical protein ZWY2020_018414 [Hordeum vulgare]|nr:hypothetical protein ZWY2020_018414 [Hordeum vulgare]